MADAAAAIAVAVLAIGYLAAFPHDLWTGDEGRYLYEAKRVLAGDVPYRDFFDFTTPALWYLFAASFALFGTTIATAKITMAVVQGLTTVLLFLVCRSAGVRRSLAVVVAVAHVALFVPVWPYVSPHWMATLLILALVLAVLRAPWDRDRRWTAALGALTGLLALVLQHEGALFALGTCLLLTLDHLLQRRFGAVPASLIPRIASYLAGIALVLVPVFALLVATAGFAPVFDALVVFPLVDYREFNSAPWAAYGLYNQRSHVYTIPVLLAYGPAALAVPAVRGVWCWWQREAQAELRRLMALVLFALLSIWSIFNYPDIIHVAFVSPLLAALAAVSIETLLLAVPERVRNPLATAGALALLAMLALQLGRNMQRRLREFPLRHETAFGTIAFDQQQEIDLLEAVRERLRASGATELFCYPACSQLYLETGLPNATRHQWLQYGYYRPQQFEETLAVLERKQLPWIVYARILYRPDDPILEYLGEHYERVPLGFGPLSPQLYRRLEPRRGE